MAFGRNVEFGAVSLRSPKLLQAGLTGLVCWEDQKAERSGGVGGMAHEVSEGDKQGLFQ